MRRTEWVVKRLIYAVITIFLAVTFSFFLFRVMPGSAVSNLSRVPHITPEARKALAERFGLDAPMWQQYLIYLRELLHGNMGISFYSQRPVTSELVDALRLTLPMVTLATVLSIGLGVVSGVFAAWRRGTGSEKANTGFAMVLYSLPTQWLAMMMILLFANTLHWLPGSGASSEFDFLTTPTLWESVVDHFKHMILPAVTLALVLYGEYTLVVRSSLLETLGEDYILTGRAKGLSDRRIMRKYALRNGMLPTVTLIALSLGFIAAGSVLIETVFSYPGIGMLMYTAVSNRDYPLLQGTFLVIAVSVIFFNLVADLIYFKLDPRIRE